MTPEGASVLIWKATWLPGSETFVRNQVDALRRWHASCLGIKAITSPLARSSDRVIYGDGPLEKVKRRAFMHSRSSARLNNAIERASPDLIHAHFASDATLIAPTARRLGLPLVVTAHGSDVLVPDAHHPSIRRRIAAVLQEAERVVAVSSYIASHVQALGVDPARIVVHHTGIPLGDPPLVRETPYWDIACVGRLVDRKGFGDALTAAHLAQEAIGRRLRVCVMGDGPLREELEEQARSLKLSLHMTGHVPSARVARELARSRVFVGPSKTGPRGEAEAFGMVFLEAASQAIPAVGYKLGGVAEAVATGESGLLVGEGDVEALGNAIAELLVDEPRRVRLGKQGRQRVEHSFDVVQRTRVLEEIYDSMVSS